MKKTINLGYIQISEYTKTSDLVEIWTDMDDNKFLKQQLKDKIS